MLVDEMGLETVPVFERLRAEEAVVAWLVLTSALVIVGPVVFSGDE